MIDILVLLWHNDILVLLWWLMVAHFAGDYWLQTDTIAKHKNPWSPQPLHEHVPWYYWMVSHSLMQGGLTAAVLGFSPFAVLLGFLESIAHFGIDLGKCRGLYTIHVDQALHALCKITWLALFMFHTGG